MKYYSNRQALNLKQYARLVLALFVLSLLNMAIQVPAHGAMQQEMNALHQAHISHQMADITADAMHDCKCPPTLCEAISALDDQRAETPQSVSFDHLINFNAVFAKRTDAHHQHSVIQFAHHEWQHRKITPPPFSFSPIFLI